MPASFARGSKAWGHCQRCGFRYLLNELVADGQISGLRVCEECYDPKHPQERMPPLTDRMALRHATGDMDAASPEAAPPIGVDPIWVLWDNVRVDEDRVWRATVRTGGGVSPLSLIVTPTEEYVGTLSVSGNDVSYTEPSTGSGGSVALRAYVTDALSNSAQADVVAAVDADVPPYNLPDIINIDLSNYASEFGTFLAASIVMATSEWEGIPGTEGAIILTNSGTGADDVEVSIDGGGSFNNTASSPYVFPNYWLTSEVRADPVRLASVLAGDPYRFEFSLLRTEGGFFTLTDDGGNPPVGDPFVSSGFTLAPDGEVDGLAEMLVNLVSNDTDEVLDSTTMVITFTPPSNWFAEITAEENFNTPNSAGMFFGSEVRIGTLDDSEYTGSGVFVSGVWFENLWPSSDWVFRVAMAAEDGISAPPAEDAIYGVSFTDNTDTLREFIVGDAGMTSSIETGLLGDAHQQMRVWTWPVAGPAFTDGIQYIIQEVQPF